MPTCSTCSQDNRDIALYCKRCGARLQPAPDPTLELETLQGLDDLKREVRRLMQVAEVNPGAVRGRNLHTIIYGSTGTGKSQVAHIIYRLFHKFGLTAKEKVVVVDVTDAGEFERELDSKLAGAKGGVLFVDNAHRLVSATSGGGSAALDRLISRMDASGYDPVVVLAGLRKGIKDYIASAPEIRARFGYTFDLPDLSADDLLAIASSRIAAQGLHLSAPAVDRLRAALRHLVRTKDASFANARAALALVEAVTAAYFMRVRSGAANDQTITPEDIQLEVPPEKSLDDILREMETFVGMANVKQEVRRITQQIQMGQRLAQQGIKRGDDVIRHFVITGKPGTGKTTVARKLGEIFESIRLLERGHVVEVGGNDLMGQYLGETPKKVNALCDEAMGGVLFVDEAYAIAGGKDGSGATRYGQEAVDTLLKRMEDDRGKFVVIVAGYKEEMERFLQMNPGLRSRFTTYLHIDDYTPPELLAIFERMAASQSYTLSAAAREKLARVTQDLYDRRGPDFANGRAVRQLFEQAIGLQSNRLAEMPPEAVRPDLATVIEADDIAYDLPEAVTLDDVLGELRGLVGMPNIKAWIGDMASVLAVQKRRAELTGQKTTITSHLVLTGNPGTGKSTVARLLGRVLKALGVLSRGHVLDVERKDLVASYVGQTAPRTHEAIRNAFGGVLFIDEAYTLAQDAFGKEAIDTLLKQMEDQRGQFVVVVAGYPKEMRDFIDANPGLASRFNQTFHLDDYTPDELFAIFEVMAAAQHYRLDSDAAAPLRRMLQALYDGRDRNFGNARTVRSLLEQSIVRQNKRLSAVAEPTAEDYSTLHLADIPGLDQSAARSLDDILSEIDALVGLAKVKRDVRELASFLKVRELRRQQGEAMSGLNLHFVFRGNPGTGKTTVARLLAEVFKALGLLSKGQLIEAAREDLVAGYVGQTAIKTKGIIDLALGGVLFVDEAYTLSRGGGNDFGIEAINTLLKRMEDDRGKFIVIAAGYDEEMDAFLAANTGLQSRFSRYIDFDDYTPDEMSAIFRAMAGREGFTLTSGAGERLEAVMNHLYATRDASFANGRTVRNLFDEVRQSQAVRVVAMMEQDSNVPSDVLNRLEATDFPLTIA